jgi:ankyrin repeat protein
MSRLVRVLLAASVVVSPVALSAQQMSESYEFLKAVREANGTKVTEMLDKPGSTIINTKDRGNGEGALHIVVKRNDATYVRFLASRGANLNLQDARGNTPLMLAVETNCFECLDALLKARANANLANASGETPLVRAVQNRNLEMVQRLLSSGANPDQADVIAGMSARDYARRDTRSPAITRLLEAAPKASTRAVSGPKL